MRKRLFSRIWSGSTVRTFQSSLVSQDSSSCQANRKKKGKFVKKRLFTEGWVEFLKKKTAKSVAANLNNTKIGGKKSNRYHDYLWNIKYLSRFKWIHLSERLSYERHVYKQRLRTEVSQAKKMADHFMHSVEMAEKKKKKGEKPTDEELQESRERFLDKTKNKTKKGKKTKETPQESREEFIKSLFS